MVWHSTNDVISNELLYQQAKRRPQPSQPKPTTFHQEAHLNAPTTVRCSRNPKRCRTASNLEKKRKAIV
ncbi:hypothetical protein T07_12841 [Trichinella nelsoni]|uniref:Uncharacterized protein n=1 Tax=Trichinella nelsoni TaxID=6336 RepID=A0A0V0RRZ5_9BILA|nr:hypothetical protein T07_12841 [Trichinella nelsoni]